MTIRCLSFSFFDFALSIAKSGFGSAPTIGPGVATIRAAILMKRRIVLIFYSFAVGQRTFCMRCTCPSWIVVVNVTPHRATFERNHDDILLTRRLLRRLLLQNRAFVARNYEWSAGRPSDWW